MYMQIVLVEKQARILRTIKSNSELLFKKNRKISYLVS